MQNLLHKQMDWQFVMFNQQMHKMFINTRLFIIAPSGGSLYAKVIS